MQRGSWLCVQIILLASLVQGVQPQVHVKAAPPTQSDASEPESSLPTRSLQLGWQFDSQRRQTWAYRLVAEGEYRPDTGGSQDSDATESNQERPSSPEDSLEDPLVIRVVSSLNWSERAWTEQRGNRGLARRVVRKFTTAGATISGSVRQSQPTLRQSRSRIVLQRDTDTLRIASPDGPLKAEELDLLSLPGDPLSLDDLLPEESVELGSNWKVGPGTAKSLSGYDAIAVNGLTAKLQNLTDHEVILAIDGLVEGASNGGQGSIRCRGTCRIDSKVGRLLALEVERAEIRQPGPLAAGLKMRSRITLEAQEDEDAQAEDSSTQTKTNRQADRDRPDSSLDRFGLQALPNQIPTSWFDLEYQAPGGDFLLKHDRSWHLYWDDSDRTVLTQIVLGEPVVQCNIQRGPRLDAGQQVDASTFRRDVARALGPSLTRVVELKSGRLGSSGGPRSPELTGHRLVLDGEVDEVEVRWIYYALAGRDGQQWLATFTMAANRVESFGNGDRRLLRTLTLAKP